MAAIRMLLLVLVAAGCGAARASAKTIVLPEAQEIQLALEAGPEHLRTGAAVYVYGPSGYRKVREGTNGFICLVNRDGNQSDDNDLKPTCWDAEGSRTIVPIMLRVGELIAQSASAGQIREDVDAGFASGKFTSPKKAGIAYMLRGDVIYDPGTGQIVRAGPAHYMIYAPAVSGADIGAGGPHPASQYALPSVFTGYTGGDRIGYIIVPAAAASEHQH